MNLRERGHIPDKDAVAREVDFIRLSEIIEHRGYRLPAGSGIICNILLCQWMF